MELLLQVTLKKHERVIWIFNVHYKSVYFLFYPFNLTAINNNFYWNSLGIKRTKEDVREQDIYAKNMYASLQYHIA